MKKVVIDTGVFVRALINPSGVNAQLFQLAHKYEVIVSEPIIEELIEVLYRSSLRNKYLCITKINIKEILEVIKVAKHVVPKRKIVICRDPDDNKFIECAVEGKVDYIISGDKDLLDMKEYEGIKIVSGTEFVKMTEWKE